MQHKWRVISILTITSALALVSNSQTPPENSRTPLDKANKRPAQANSKTSFSNSSVDYKELLASAKDDPLVLNKLAVRLTRDGRHTDAARLIQRALEISPGNAPLLVNLAIVYANGKQYKKALGALDAATELDPEYVRTRPMRCDLLSHTSRHSEAVTCFDEQLEAGKTLDSVSTSNLAVSLTKAGEFEKALPILKEAYARFPNDPTLLNNYAILLYEAKEFKESSVVLERLVKLRPAVAQYRFNLGVVQLARGKRRGAIKQYNVLKKSDPKLAEALFELLFSDQVVDASEGSRE